MLFRRFRKDPLARASRKELRRIIELTRRDRDTIDELRELWRDHYYLKCNVVRKLEARIERGNLEYWAALENWSA